MDLKQNPFSLYDFLGYLTPGAIAVYGGLLFYAAPNIHSGPDVVRALGAAEFNLTLLIPFLLLSYVLGHILSFLSSVTVERYAIWTCGYPSRFLLGYPQNRKYLDVSNIGGYERFEKIARRLVQYVLWPIVLVDVPAKLIALRDHSRRSLSPELVELLRNKVKGLLMQHGEVPNPDIDQENEFFRYVYHYARENAANHVTSMQNYVALYGFLRTMCLMFVVAVWWIGGYAIFHLVQVVWSNFDFHWYLVWWFLAFLVASYVTYMGFLKFYRRFSLEALMAMSIAYSNSKASINESK